MKSIVIFFLFFFPYVICNAQSDCTNDTTMYLVAYNYIINDSTNQGKSISVSDSIIDLDRFWFSEDLIALPMEKVKLDKYRANKGYVWYPPFYSPCIALLFGNNSQHQNDVLFFSKIEDNGREAQPLYRIRGIIFIKIITQRFVWSAPIRKKNPIFIINKKINYSPRIFIGNITIPNSI